MEFNPLAIKLSVSVFHGNLKLRSKPSLSLPTLLKWTEESTSNEPAVIEVTLKFNGMG